MFRDDQIQQELDVYNPLLPGPGRLSATLFIELTSTDALRLWLPRLVGIEAAIELRVGVGGNNDDVVVVGSVNPEHQAQLTRSDVTAAVHYVCFELTDAQVERFGSGPVTLAVNLPGYAEATVLSDETRAALLKDLTGAS